MLAGNALKFTQRGQVELAVWVARGPDLSVPRLLATMDPRWAAVPPPKADELATMAVQDGVATRVVMLPTGPAAPPTRLRKRVQVAQWLASTVAGAGRWLWPWSAGATEKRSVGRSDLTNAESIAC